MADDEIISEKFQPACWAVGGFRIFFPVGRNGFSGANRIVERERPFRRGAKLDNTGSKARRWRLTVPFSNELMEGEPDLENGGLRLYPDVLNLMLQSFDEEKTGDLTLPREGKVRAKAESFEGDEDPASMRDGSVVTLTFVEDNEDSVGAASFAAPSASANARRLAEATTFDQESLGNGHLTIAQMQGFVSDLEGLVNAPFDAKQELEWTAKRIADLAKQTVSIFSQAGVKGRDTLLGPRGSRAESKMARAQDMAARASAQSLQNRPSIGRFITNVDTSIFDIAAFTRQPADELMAINPQIEDLLFIPKGSEVRVFTSTGTVA